VKGSNDVRSNTTIANLLVEQALDLAATDYNLKKQYGFRDIEIVLNLVRNALQAMANADHSDRPVSRPRLTLRASLASNSTWVRLEIEDNGPGIPEAVRE
jgi:nitrogen-specific signal transduction histidine kinase